MKNTLFDVAILAGGFATRLRPLTESQPKSLVIVHGEPFISHQLRLLKKQNIQRVVICIGNMGEMVQDYVGNGERFDLQISYSSDAEKALGTAGAIKKALPLLAENFFVLYGDSYLRCDFSAVQEKFVLGQKKALMTVFYNDGQWDKSNVEYINDEIVVYDKNKKTENMRYIDYGLGVFKKTAFAHLLENTPFDLADLYRTMLAEQQLAAHEVKERFYEIGSFAGLAELEKLIKCNL